MKILLLLFMLYGPASGSTDTLASNDLTVSDYYQKYSFKIVGSNEGTFGYEIYSDKKVFIRQLTIPGMRGNTGFHRKKDAVKIARLVIDKLSKGIIPPTVDKKEMDQLHIKL